MSRKPNILWICSDQQRYDTLGCNGNPMTHTPNIDMLAQNGVRLNHAYVQSPVCAPSRASFLSGRYPRTCGLRQNGQDIPETEKLLPRIFADNGYVCGLSGKLHLSACMPNVSPETERRIDDGYSFFSWSHHPAKAGKGNWAGNAYTNWLTSLGMDFHTEKLPECRFVQKGMPAKYSQTTWCFNEAIRFIEDQREGQPWFFSINCYDPHHPFDPPMEYLERYLPLIDEIPLPEYVPGELDAKPVFQRQDHQAAYEIPGNFPFTEMTERDHRYLKAAYWAMVDQIDDQVGRIVGFLREKGLLEDTIIIFTSDHGESLGDHGIYLKGPYCYENAIHVPFVISWAGHILKGITREAMVEMVDLAPTLCEAAGIEPYAGFQGKSLLPLLTDHDAEDRFRESVYAEYYNSNINHRDPKAFLTTVRTQRWKLTKVHCGADGEDMGGEMYDLENDPSEHINLYDDPAFLEQKAEMLALLSDRMAQTLDPLLVRKAFW